MVLLPKLVTYYFIDNDELFRFRICKLDCVHCLEQTTILLYYYYYNVDDD